MIMLFIGSFLTNDLRITAQLVLFILLSCFAFSMLGVTAGLLARSSQTLNMISGLVILPMTFMCGTLFSVDSLPKPLADVIWILPLTHSSELIRSAALGWDIPWVSIGVMILYTAAFFGMDYYAIRKGKY